MNTLIFFLLIILIISLICGFCWKRIQQAFDRAFSKSNLHQLGWLGVGILLIFGILLLGNALTYPLRCESVGDRTLNLIGHFLNPGNFDKKGESGNEWVLLVGIAGMIFLGGILISVISNMLERRIDNVRSGQVHYKFANHIVIIGYDKMVTSLIKQIVERNPACQCEIVLQTTRKVPVVRHELFSNLESRLEKRITLISGNRSSKEDLEKLRLPQATEIFILGENGEYDHDSLNMECLKITIDLCKDVSRELKKCHLLLEYQSTYAIFQQHEQLKYNYLDVLPFNFYELWARKLFVGGKYLPDINYPPLDRELITENSEKQVHLVIVAATRMGVALAVEAARIAHYANYKKQKTRITIIDSDAKKQMHIMHSRYAAFFEAIDVNYYNCVGKEEKQVGELSAFTDISLDFMEGNVESPAIRQKLVEWSEDSVNQILTIAVCFNNPPASLAVGLYLPDAVYTNQIPVFIRLETSDHILHAFENEGKYQYVYAFGMTDQCYEQELVEDMIPQFIQYIYYNQFDFAEIRPFPTKETLVESWMETPVVHKWSNRYNADMIPGKLRTAGIRIEKYEDIKQLAHVDWTTYDEMEYVLAQMEHNRWNIERLLAGYRRLNDDRKNLVLNLLTDDALKDNIKNLKTIKDQCFEASKRYVALRKKSPQDSNALTALQEEIKQMEKGKIKPAKRGIVSQFYHDCIAPYEDISNLDQYSDIAITKGIKWIINDLLKKKGNISL